MGVNEMAYTQAQNKATQKYQKTHLEQLSIRVPKGKRAEYKALADARGVSLAGLITSLLDAELKKEPEG